MLKHKYGFNLVLATLVVAVAAFWGAPAAQAADTVQAVAQSYHTSQPLQQGMIVQLDDKDSSKVSPATYNAPKKMFGVTVAASQTPVSLSSESSERQVYVVTSGRYKVLVSNQHGTITVGDFIGMSAIDGIGMKEDDASSTILGRAVEGFDGRNGVLSTAALTLKDGRRSQTAIGSILVDVAIRSNPNFTGVGGVPSFMQGFAVGVVGQQINAGQLYASLAILALGLGVVAVLIYSGIQTSMAAIGRNPLARQSIMRNMLQVIITAAIIFIGCLIAVYLILKL